MTKTNIDEEKSTKLKLISELMNHWTKEDLEDEWYGDTFDRLYDRDIKVLKELKKLIQK